MCLHTYFAIKKCLEWNKQIWRFQFLWALSLLQRSCGCRIFHLIILALRESLIKSCLIIKAIFWAETETWQQLRGSFSSFNLDYIYSKFRTYFEDLSQPCSTALLFCSFRPPSTEIKTNSCVYHSFMRITTWHPLNYSRVPPVFKRKGKNIGHVHWRGIWFLKASLNNLKHTKITIIHLFKQENPKILGLTQCSSALQSEGWDAWLVYIPVWCHHLTPRPYSSSFHSANTFWHYWKNISSEMLWTLPYICLRFLYLYEAYWEKSDVSLIGK